MLGIPDQIDGVLHFYKALFIDLWIRQGDIDYMEVGQGQSFEAQRKFVQALMRSEENRGGRGEQEIDSLINQRIKKFYINDDYIEVDTEHFKPRVEPLYLPGVEPTDDTLLLFGIDFMSKQQLKAYFAQFSPQYYFLDESNCIIKFASPEAAKLAIRENLRPDSHTRYKVEEDAEEGVEVGLQLSLPKPQPKEWIQLRPYTYSFKKTKFSVKDYERKLYVRYATNKEMQIGFDRASFYDGLLTRCRLIWEKEAKKDEELRKFLEGKMKAYRETISSYGKRSEKSHPHSQRSRSRDKFKTPNNQETTPRRTDVADQSLNFEIRSRSENSQDLRNLMNEFQQLNMDGGVSIIGNISMLKDKKLNITGMSGAPEVGYKVAQPEQLRLEFKHGHFDYKKYVQQSMQREEKKKRVAVVDLTDD